MAVGILADFTKRFVCYFPRVSNVQELFQLFALICVKSVRVSAHVPQLSSRVDFTRD